MDHTYTAVTQHIKISVQPDHLEDSSDPNNNVFAFSYTIRIENLGDETVQLLERHWIITSGGAHLAEVVGPGVVGHQPVLESGQSYEYTSGAVIHDPIGAMKGSYTFRSNKGDFFEVAIPPFDLLYPVVIH